MIFDIDVQQLMMFDRNVHQPMKPVWSAPGGQPSGLDTFTLSFFKDVAHTDTRWNSGQVKKWKKSKEKSVKNKGEKRGKE